MRLALSQAEKCSPAPSAFSVGCVIVCRWPYDSSSSVVVSNGYSREIDGNTHAEANAMTKARQLTPQELSKLFQLPTSEVISIHDVLHNADVYTTMEPCSVRLSGLPPCADALIEAGIRRCFIGVGEPDDFVKCEGASKLKDANIQVIWLKGLEKECLEIARRGR